MESLSVISIKKFKDTAERILHVPGNYRGGILEMSVIVDTRLKREQAASLLPQLLKALKQQGTVFRNVRFNYVLWEAAGLKTRVCPMMLPMTESFYEDYESSEEEKDFSELVENLKKFHARSKLVILVTNRSVEDLSGENTDIHKRMQPFLDKKLMIVEVKDEKDGGGILIHYREI